MFPRPLLKFQRPPFAAPGVRPIQSPAPKSGRLREQSQGCQEGGGGAGRECGESSGHCPVRAELSALAALPPVQARGGCAPAQAWGAQKDRASPKAGLEVAARPSWKLGGSGGREFPDRASPERCVGAPGVPRACGHPIRPLAAQGTRRAPPLPPPPPRNELSTVALGAARSHARICPRAANREAGSPWEG